MNQVVTFSSLLVLITFEVSCSKFVVPLIDGGLNADHGQFPWHVSINETKGLKCGGILISHDYVLTAGHCYHPKPDYTIGLGSTRLDHQKYVLKPKRFIVHPDFKNGVNDIAMIQLERPVNFDSDVQPVKLATAGMGDFNGTCPFVTGFGQTKGKKSMFY